MRGIHLLRGFPVIVVVVVVVGVVVVIPRALGSGKVRRLGRHDGGLFWLKK